MVESISHSEFLNRAEQQVEEQLKEVISVFQNLPEDQLISNNNGGWSIAECFDHLNSYADFYLPRLRKSLEKMPPLKGQTTFKHSFLGSYFIKAMDYQQTKKKYKAMRKHRPTIINNPYAVVSMFIQHLEELQKIILQANQKNLMKAIVSTSISPFVKINVGDAIQFVLTHNRRHIEQARRNIHSARNTD